MDGNKGFDPKDNTQSNEMYIISCAENEFRNRRRWLISAIVVLLGVAVVCFCMWARHQMMNSPAIRLTKGVTNLVNELAKTDNPMLTPEGLGTLISELGDGGATIDYSLNISQNPLLQDITLGIDGSVSRDMEDEMFNADLISSVSKVEILNASITGAGNRIYLRLPDIFDGSIVFRSDDIDGQINHSDAAGLIGLSMKEDLDIDLYQKIEGWEYRIPIFLIEILGKKGEYLSCISIEENKDYCLTEEQQRILTPEASESPGRTAKLWDRIFRKNSYHDYRIYIPSVSDPKDGDGILMEVLLDPQDRIVEIQGNLLSLGQMDLSTLIGQWDTEQGTLSEGVANIKEKQAAHVANDYYYRIFFAGKEDTIDRIEAGVFRNNAEKTGELETHMIHENVLAFSRGTSAFTAMEEACESDKQYACAEIDYDRETEICDVKLAVDLSGVTNVDAAVETIPEEIRSEIGMAENDRIVDEDYLCSLAFTISDYVPGESANLNLSELRLGRGETTLLKAAGDIRMRELSETIVVPDGAEYALLEMNSMEAGWTVMSWLPAIQKKYGGYFELMGLDLLK